MTELRWLHELRMKQYGRAAATLQRVAGAGAGFTVRQAQRAACLAKLALDADRPSSFTTRTAEVGTWVHWYWTAKPCLLRHHGPVLPQPSCAFIHGTALAARCIGVLAVKYHSAKVPQLFVKASG